MDNNNQIRKVVPVRKNEAQVSRFIDTGSLTDPQRIKALIEDGIKAEITKRVRQNVNQAIKIRMAESTSIASVVTKNSQKIINQAFIDMVDKTIDEVVRNMEM